jgi:hypothetical protein
MHDTVHASSAGTGTLVLRVTWLYMRLILQQQNYPAELARLERTRSNQRITEAPSQHKNRQLIGEIPSIAVLFQMHTVNMGTSEVVNVKIQHAKVVGHFAKQRLVQATLRVWGHPCQEQAG